MNIKILNVTKIMDHVNLEICKLFICFYQHWHKPLCGVHLQGGLHYLIFKYTYIYVIYSMNIPLITL